MFKRIIEPTIKDLLNKPEMVVIYGPRRVGKTTLLKKIQSELPPETRSIFYSLDDPSAVSIFQDFSSVKLNRIFIELGMSPDTKNYLFLDEIQGFTRIDGMLKLIYDHFSWVKVVATSSSSLLLLQHLTESLAGRKRFVELLPLTLSEQTGKQVVGETNRELLQNYLEQALIYGLYPEVVLRQTIEDKVSKLSDIVESSLYKDVFILENIKAPKVLMTLVELLAYQIGNLVNLSELAQQLGVSRNTVDQYISILEKFFIIFRLRPFERNLRSEIGSKFKIYFWDPGIRNAVIQKFTPFAMRDDKGALLENMVILSLLKMNYYSGQLQKSYFWRTYEGFEIDLILEQVTSGNVAAFQIATTKTPKFSRAFDVYKPSQKKAITLKNALYYCL